MNKPNAKDMLNLHALADGQLSQQEKEAIKSQIESDPTMRAEFEAILSIKQFASAKFQHISDEDVWISCTNRLNAIDKSKGAESFVSKYAWGLCALFLVAIISAGLVNRRNGGSTLYTGDVASMASGLVPIGLPSSSEKSSVQQYVREKTGGAPIDIASGQMQLVSVMQGVRGGKLVTMFNFADSGGPLSLIVVPDTESVEGMSESPENRQYCHGLIGRLYCVSWVDDGFALLLLSQQGFRSTNELQDIASRIRIHR